MTLPDIHPSHRLAQSLADQYRQSASHTRAALETIALPSRDGYSQTQDFEHATAEHAERLAKLQAVAADLDTLAKHYEGQGEPQAAEPAQLLRIFYVCPRCSHEWEEEYSTACDSECPECNLENIEAERWEDIDAEPETAPEPEPLCPRCNQVQRMPGFELCHSCQQFEDAD